MGEMMARLAFQDLRTSSMGECHRIVRGIEGLNIKDTVEKPLNLRFWNRSVGRIRFPKKNFFGWVQVRSKMSSRDGKLR
jgi:hypothetical protein